MVIPSGQFLCMTAGPPSETSQQNNFFNIRARVIVFQNGCLAFDEIYSNDTLAQRRSTVHKHAMYKTDS